MKNFLKLIFQKRKDFWEMDDSDLKLFVRQEKLQCIQEVVQSLVKHRFIVTRPFVRSFYKFLDKAEKEVYEIYKQARDSKKNIDSNKNIYE